MRDILELVGERGGREQRDEQAQWPPRTHAAHQRHHHHRTPHMTRAHDNRHSTGRSTWNKTPFALHSPDSVTQGRTFVHESSSGRVSQVRDRAGVVRAGRRRGQACRAPSRAAAATPARSPRTPHPRARTDAARESYAQ